MIKECKKNEYAKKLDQIIPPNDYLHRSEFSNHYLIDGLGVSEKEIIETDLIERLRSTPEDILIIETLAYMGSKKAIAVMKNSLELCTNNVQKVIIAASIFKINNDNKMMSIAIYL